MANTILINLIILYNENHHIQYRDIQTLKIKEQHYLLALIRPV